MPTGAGKSRGARCSGVLDPMTRSPTQRLGDAGEDRALELLERAGLSLVARQVACRFGEIDLIMRDRNEWVFVEVRRRSRADFGSAAESITPAKQQRLRRSAQTWLQQQGSGRPAACRFDVCAIDGNEIEWIRNAF